MKSVVWHREVEKGKGQQREKRGDAGRDEGGVMRQKRAERSEGRQTGIKRHIGNDAGEALTHIEVKGGKEEHRETLRRLKSYQRV